MTATDENGTVHDLAAPDMSVCGKPAGSWSREVTVLQQVGLAVFCEDCRSKGVADDLAARP